MNPAEPLVAVSTLMIEAASHEDWPSVAALDVERRSLIAALPATLDANDVSRLRALDQQLLALAGAERSRLSERVRVGQKLDRAARQYEVAARTASGARGATG